MRRLLLVAALGLLWPASAHAEPRGVVIDRVVLVVNDEPVFESEVARRAERAGISRARAIDELIDEALLLAVARRLDVTVSAEEVEAAIDEIKASNQIDDAQLEAALVAAHTTLDEYRQDVAHQILLLRTQNLLALDVDVSERDPEVWRAARDEAFVRWRAEQRRLAYIERREAP